jgi:hypothetical protein
MFDLSKNRLFLQFLKNAFRLSLHRHEFWLL